MNFFQVTITLLIIILLVSISRSRVIILERFFYILVSLVGLYFIFFPESASVIAKLVGIGRGADLVFYLFILFTWFWFSSSSIKMRRTERKITDIVRAMAIENPLRLSKPAKDDEKKTNVQPNC